MDFDPTLIKNTFLRAKLLEMSGQQATPPPAQKSVFQDAPSSTIIKTSEIKSTEIFFTVKGLPMGKPRQTQRDRWMKRPCVVRYREYADRIRAAAGTIKDNPIGIHIRAFFPMTASWSAKKKTQHNGQRHRLRPDWDNTAKAICDSLLDEDSCIAVGIAEKFWCDEGDERTEIKIIYDEASLSSITATWNLT